MTDRATGRDRGVSGGSRCVRTKAGPPPAEKPYYLKAIASIIQSDIALEEKATQDLSSKNWHVDLVWIALTVGEYLWEKPINIAYDTPSCCWVGNEAAEVLLASQATEKMLTASSFLFVSSLSLLLATHILRVTKNIRCIGLLRIASEKCDVGFPNK
jgi:hypothetical protein